MMLLGLVSHAANPYMTFRYMTSYWYHDAARSTVADALMLGIHVFRLPLFFVMAGFFTALLVERRGVAGMLRNRLVRVSLVLALFWVMLRPLNRLVVQFARMEQLGGDGIAAVRAMAAAGPKWTDSMLHLWFLWYLTLFYLAAVMLIPALRRLPRGMVATCDRGFRGLIGNPWRSALLGLPTALLLGWQGGGLRPVVSFVPNLLVLGTYALFFVVGWLLWRHRDMVPALAARAWLQLAIGGTLLIPSVPLQKAALATGDHRALIGASLIGGLSTWLLIFGITGVALRHADRPNPVARYVTDASYWMYLVHFPLIFVAAGLLSESPWPAMAKLLLVLTGVAAVTVVTYHVLVRHTVLGVLLNGRRGGSSQHP